MVVSQAVLPAILRDAGVALLVVNSAGRVQYANPAAHALLDRRELTGSSIAEAFAESERATVAAFVDSLDVTAEGRSRESAPFELARSGPRLVTISGSALRDLPGYRGAVLALHEVTDLVCREEQLARAAYADELTGLTSRSLGLRHLRAAASPAAPGSVLVIDVDGFADLNDALGTAEGDRILVAVAQRVTRAVPRGSVVARIGGDEFLVLLPRMPPAQAEELAHEVLVAVNLPVDVAGTPVQVNVSIGVAPLAATDGREVIGRALGALYDGKGRGPGSVGVNAEARTDAGTGLPDRRRLEEDLPAIQQAAASSGRIVGVVLVALDRSGLLDRHRGEQAGDAALAQVAAVLSSHARSGDRFYRSGSEEFVGLLRETDLRAALLIAERLRATVAAAGIPHGGHPAGPTLTVSIGVAADSVANRSLDQLVATAGREMLHARRAGGNRVSPRLDIRPDRKRRSTPEPHDDDAA